VIFWEIIQIIFIDIYIYDHTWSLKIGWSSNPCKCSVIHDLVKLNQQCMIEKVEGNNVKWVDYVIPYKWIMSNGLKTWKKWIILIHQLLI
jgi:hypothetical protein